MGSGREMVANGAKQGDLIEKIMQKSFEITVVGEAMLKWSHNSTLFCTLSHYSTAFSSHGLRSGLYTQVRSQ